MHRITFSHIAREKSLAEVNDNRIANPESSNGNLSTADGGCDKASGSRTAEHAGGRRASGTGTTAGTLAVVAVVSRGVSHTAGEAAGEATGEATGEASKFTGRERSATLRERCRRKAS